MPGNITREFLSGVGTASCLMVPICYRRWSIAREGGPFLPLGALLDAAVGTLRGGRPFITGSVEGLKAGRRGDYS
jgi:hypothetical protein